MPAFRLREADIELEFSYILNGPTLDMSRGIFLPHHQAMLGTPAGYSTIQLNCDAHASRLRNLEEGPKGPTKRVLGFIQDRNQMFSQRM